MLHYFIALLLVHTIGRQSLDYLVPVRIPERRARGVDFLRGAPGLQRDALHSLKPFDSARHIDVLARGRAAGVIGRGLSRARLALVKKGPDQPDAGLGLTLAVRTREKILLKRCRVHAEEAVTRGGSAVLVLRVGICERRR